MIKKPPASSEDMRDVGLIPGSGRCPGGGHCSYSCHRVHTVHRVTQSRTRLKQLSTEGRE